MKLFTVDQNKCVFVCVTITANFVYTMMLTPHDDNVQDMSSRIVRQKSNWGTDRDKSNFVRHHIAVDLGFSLSSAFCKSQALTS